MKRGCDLLIFSDQDQKIAASFHSTAPTQLLQVLRDVSGAKFPGTFIVYRTAPRLCRPPDSALLLPDFVRRLSDGPIFIGRNPA